LAATLLGQAVQLLPVHTAIAIAVGTAEVLPQPGVSLRFAAVDAAIAVAICLAEEARGSFAALGFGRLQLVGGEKAPLLVVQPLEVAFEIGVPLHFLALQALVAIAVKALEQLLEPLLIALLLRGGLSPARRSCPQAQGQGERESALGGCMAAAHALRLWSRLGFQAAACHQAVTRSV